MHRFQLYIDTHDLYLWREAARESGEDSMADWLRDRAKKVAIEELYVRKPKQSGSAEASHEKT